MPKSPMLFISDQDPHQAMARAEEVATWLIRQGARFVCEPWPNDQWRFEVRSDREDALRGAQARSGGVLAVDDKEV